MRLAYLTSQYPAISHTFVRREVHELRRQGFSVDTFSIRPTQNADRLTPVDQEEQRRTINVLPTSARRLGRAHLKALRARPMSYLRTGLRALRHRAPGAKGALWSAFHFAEAIQLAGDLEAKGSEHLHVHFGNSGATVGYLAAAHLELPWSFTIHGNSEFDFPAGYLLGEKIREATIVNCVTHFGRSQAMRLVEPNHWDKLQIVRAGIEPPQNVLAGHPTPKPEPRPEGELRLVCVARLARAKGHVGLIQAFAGVLEQGINAKLELLGGGPERPLIEAEIARRGIGEHVIFRGHAPEHEALQAMQSATAVVLASFIEGLPCVLMEALALGVPVIAPCLAGIPELVENGVSGLTFPPGDWKSLSQALTRMLGDGELRTRLAAEGQARVQREFFVDKSVQPWVASLRARAGAPPASSAVAELQADRRHQTVDGNRAPAVQVAGGQV